MIKFIATDMDGTLLRDDKTFNKEIFDVINILSERGTFFAPASSRPAVSLGRTFEPVKDKVFIIAQNGASVFYKGRRFLGEVMERELVKHIIDVCGRYPSANMLIDGERYSYTDKPFVQETMNTPMFNYDSVLIDDLYSVKEDVFKISIFDPTDTDGAIRHNIAKKLEGLCETAVSGPGCLDFVNTGVSKGTAVEKICKKLGIAFNEAAVFGDNFNDVSMFEKVYYSFAMGNASAEVKALARFTAQSNNDDGVLRTVKRLCFEVEE